MSDLDRYTECKGQPLLLPEELRKAIVDQTGIDPSWMILIDRGTEDEVVYESADEPRAIPSFKVDRIAAPFVTAQKVECTCVLICTPWGCFCK